MKTVLIILVVVFAAALIQSAKLDYHYFLPQVIPGFSGEKLGIYDVIGVAMIILFLYAIKRMNRGKRRYRNKGFKPNKQYYQGKSHNYGQYQNNRRNIY